MGEEQLIQDFQNWIENNQDLKGTEDYETVLTDLNALKASTDEIKVTGEEEPFEFSFGEMVGNIPESFQSEMGDIVAALSDPVGTGKSLYNTALGFAQKLVPGAQDKEVYADALVQYFKNKYASGGEAFLKELQNNPMGVASDASLFIGVPSGAVSGAGKIISKTKKLDAPKDVNLIPQIIGQGGEAVQKAGDFGVKLGASIDPLNLGINTVGTAGIFGASKVSDAISGIPQSWYESGIKIPPRVDDVERAKIIQTALDEKIPLTKTGKNILNQKIEELSSKVNNLIDTASQTEKGIPSSVIKDYIGDVKNQFKGFVYKGSESLDEIKAVEKRLDDLIKNNKVVTARDLQDFKTKLYKDLDYDVRQDKTSRAGEMAEKQVARGAKEAIEKQIPSTAELNRRLGDLLESKPYLISGINRIGNRQLFGRGLFGLLDMPGARSRLAIDLNQRMRNPLASLFDNTMSGAGYLGPTTRGSLATVGDVNMENQGLLSMDDIKERYGL